MWDCFFAAWKVRKEMPQSLYESESVVFLIKIQLNKKFECFLVTWLVLHACEYRLSRGRGCSRSGFIMAPAIFLRDNFCLLNFETVVVAFI